MAYYNVTLILVSSAMSVEDQEKNKNNLPEEITDNLKRLGLAVPVWEREVTAAEIQYFIDRWPFLQILSMNALDSLEEVELLRAKKSNWTILNYGDALASSPGEFLFGGGDFRISLSDDEDDGDSGDGIVNPDKGTIWRQAYVTAEEMVTLAKELGWAGIHIVDGNPLMKWAAWMHAMDDKMELTGFKPSKRDQERRERVKRSELDDIKLFTRMSPQP